MVKNTKKPVSKLVKKENVRINIDKNVGES